MNNKTEPTSTDRDSAASSATGQASDPGAMVLSDDTPNAVNVITENIEAIIVAFVMALIVKQFVLEVFKIPSDSMFPTLNGDISNGDRVVVNKMRFLVGKPERWDVTVFKYPLDVTRPFIKRLVGLPGERLSVVDGDVWIDGEIERKPIGVQRSIWIERYPTPPKFGDRTQFHPANCDWRTVTGTWPKSRGAFSTKVGRGEKATIALDFLQKRKFRPDSKRTYHEVRDYRFRGDLTTGDYGAVTITMTVRGRPFEVRLPIGREQASVTFPRDTFARVNTIDEAGGTKHLAPNDTVSIEVAHWDWWFEVRVDGEVWFSYQTDPRPWDNSAASLFRELRRNRSRDMIPQRFDKGVTALTITAEDGPVGFSDVYVDQDLHYTYASSTGVDDVEIPEGYYFMMGDHSHGSRDSREWHRIKVKDPKTGKEVWGEEYTWSLDSDHKFDERKINFVDLEGNGYRIPDFEVSSPDLGPAVLAYEPFGLIPRKNLVGRAFCVFWPFPPFSDEFRPKLVR